MEFPLRLITPAYDSPLTDLVMELEHLRRLKLAGDTPKEIFFQLKALFHLVESLGSARIEGNRTTLLDYIETKVEAPNNPNESFREIENLEFAMDYIERAVTAGAPITHQLVRELHALTVNNLTREGDKTPGAYRTCEVTISGAAHKPPEHVRVQSLMDELLAFVNDESSPKYHLLKCALAHHGFAWIHPFGNGNGRVVRLFTYALLLKYGFNVGADGAGVGRVLNPTAIFCIDRDRYYAMLAKADEGNDQSLEAWSEYVLEGILGELTKVNQLTQYAVLKSKILVPALTWSRSRGDITADQEQVLRMAVDRGTFRAADITDVLPGIKMRQRTYQLSKLIEQKMVAPINPGARTYTIQFSNSVLLRGVARMLVQEGYSPDFL